MKKSGVKINKWVQQKKTEGWQPVYFVVPEPLAKEIRECVRVWKFNNPHYYKKHI